MTIELSSYCVNLIKSTSLPLREKELLVAMAAYADSKGSGIWASNARLAQDIYQRRQLPLSGNRKLPHTSTVKKMKSRFVKKGLIKEVGQYKIPRGYMPIYQLNLPLIRSHSPRGEFSDFGRSIYAKKS